MRTPLAGVYWPEGAASTDRRVLTRTSDSLRADASRPFSDGRDNIAVECVGWDPEPGNQAPEPRTFQAAA